jgi:hypothetical protein
MMRKGVSFLLDEQGDRVAVQIDLREHGELWEDFYDSMLARERSEEPLESLEQVRERLTVSGKLPIGGS